MVLITGGNSGIGKQAAIVLARRGAQVVFTARSELRGTKARAEIQRLSKRHDVDLMLLDLGKFRSIHAFADEFCARYDRLDVLINNAGAILSDRRVTEDGFEMTFGVNHLGHFLLTKLLLGHLAEAAPARIVNVASVAHRGSAGMSFADLQRERTPYNGADAYNESKLANVLFTMELARRLDPAIVTANCCHPGPVRTGWGAAEDTRGLERFVLMLSRPFLVSARRGAKPLVHLATSPAVEGVTGGYFVGGYVPGVHRHRPSRVARDPEAARRLWDESERLVG